MCVIPRSDAAQSAYPFSKLDIHRSPNYKGYTALLGENTDPKGHGDLHEGRLEDYPLT